MDNILNYELKKINTDFPVTKITSSKESYEYVKMFYSDDIEIFESFFILMLNNSNNTIGYAKLSQGGITGTVVDVRILAKFAVDSLCTSVILAHNHPSGNLKPSDADRLITNKVVSCLKLFDIKVLDHIILTKESFYSFANNSEL